MKTSSSYLNGNIPEPSWDQVRTIYRKLSEEFHVLTDSFNVNVSDETKKHLDHLIIVIDDVDSCVDELVEKASRDSVTESLIEFLQGKEKSWFHDKASKLMMRQMEILKIIVHKEGIETRFVAAAKSIFELTEAKRHTQSVDELLNFIILEGEATAKLPLSILKIDSSEDFGLFFSRLCMLMGIADLIFDAREDYKSGYIQVKPTLTLYLRLCRILFTDGIKLLLSFPKKISFLVYCFKFSIALMKG